MPNTVTRNYTARTILASTSIGPGGSAVAGTEIDMSTTFGGKITGRIANGASTPTVGAVARLMVRQDGSGTAIQAGVLVAGVAANTNYDFVFDVSDFGRVSIVFDPPTGNAVTAFAYLHENTSANIS